MGKRGGRAGFRNWNPEKARRIDLGLAVLQARRPGEVLTREEIAAWADCSAPNIRQIEATALRKLRMRWELSEVVPRGKR